MKLDQNRFLFVDFQIFRKLSENSPRIFRKIIAEEFHQHFPEFYNFRKLSENFETILVDVRFQFCLAAESSGRMPLSCPMISQSNCEKAGQDEYAYNNTKYGIIFHCCCLVHYTGCPKKLYLILRLNFKASTSQRQKCYLVLILVTCRNKALGT